MPCRSPCTRSSSETGRAAPPPLLSAAKPLTSPPAQKAPPAPVSTTHRTDGSAATLGTASLSAAIIGPLIAFLASGRFIVSVQTPSSWVSSKCSDMVPPVSQRDDHRRAIRHQHTAPNPETQPWPIREISRSINRGVIVGWAAGPIWRKCSAARATMHLEGGRKNHLSHIPAHKVLVTVAPFRAWRGSPLFIARGPRWRIKYKTKQGRERRQQSMALLPDGQLLIRVSPLRRFQRAIDLT